jgi:hypothetical protein
MTTTYSIGHIFQRPCYQGLHSKRNLFPRSSNWQWKSSTCSPYHYGLQRTQHTDYAVSRVLLASTMDKTMQWYVVHRPQTLHPPWEARHTSLQSTRGRQVFRHCCRLLGFLSTDMTQSHPTGVPDPRMSAIPPGLWENEVRWQGPMVTLDISHPDSLPTHPVSPTADQHTDGQICHDRQLWK